MFSRHSLIYLCLLPILRVLIFRKTFITFIFSPEVLRVSRCTWRLHFFMITVVRSSTQIRNDRKHLWGTYCSAIYNLLKKKRVLSEYLICKMRNSDTFGFSFFWISKAVSLMTLSILIFNYCQQRKNNDEKFHQAK